MSDKRHLTKTEQSIMQKALHRSMKVLPDSRDAEIARLRDALEKIAETTPKPIAYAKYKDQAVAYWAVFDRCREIARAALEPKP